MRIKKIFFLQINSVKFYIYNVIIYFGLDPPPVISDDP